MRVRCIALSSILSLITVFLCYWHLKEVGCEGANWIYVAQVRVRWFCEHGNE